MWVGFLPRFKGIVVLDEWYYKGELTPQELETAFVTFLKKNADKYFIAECYADSAETTLIRGLDRASQLHALEIHQTIPVYKSAKRPINMRINAEIRLFAGGRFKIMEHCVHHIEAFSSAVWDEKKLTEDSRLDNGTVPSFDMLDACEYAWERDISALLEPDYGRGVA